VKKKVPPGTMARRYCMGGVGLRCANPTLANARVEEMARNVHLERRIGRETIF